MKNEMKKYEKPSIEVMDIQWGECIASGSTITGEGHVTLTIDSANENSSSFWVGSQNNSWDTTMF